jgi:Thioesterase-like superfamily
VNGLPDAFYLPLGDNRYRPTRAVESPWDRTAQHGGPPAALLAHVIDSGVPDGLRLARVSLDFLGPVPLAAVRVEAGPIKPGRLVHLSEARLVVAGRVAVIARAWHIATGARPPIESERLLPPELPGPAEQRFFPGLDNWGYGEAIEWRFTRGGYDVAGRADVWTRVRIPLVADAPMTGLARALIVADSANGLSAMLPMAQWLSIPPAMTTTLLREPVGEWTHLACRTRLADDGVGLAHGDLSDHDGLIGEVSQPLLVRARR